MRSNKFKVFVVSFVFLILLSGNLYAQRSEKQIYLKGLSKARSGNISFAYMNFRDIIEKFPSSRYAQDSLFAVAEYYFITHDYRKAIDAITKFINKYPESKAKPFILVYLLRIAKEQNKQELIESIESEIIAYQDWFVLARGAKGYKYRSALFMSHEAVYSTDSVELFINNDLFEKILY